ncbi:uncharacterized protein METZ01_LOCUS451157, partial [marine metagenome]
MSKKDRVVEAIVHLAVKIIVTN